MKITINTPITGSTACIDLIDYTMEEPLGENCTFYFYYGGKEYTGSVALGDEDKLLLSFENNDVALPSGICLEVSCEGCTLTADDSDCVNEELTIKDDTKLAILGEDGCPVGFIKYADIKADIMKCIKEEDLWFSFCDLLPEDGIPEGALVASDRILTTSGGCDLKSIPQSDICCNEE